MEQCGLVWGLCRICCYRVVGLLCCRKKMTARPETSLVCFGFESSGKTHMLEVFAGCDTSDIKPTKGFSIRALYYKNIIVNVKEIGGSVSVRPYWSKFIENKDFQGLAYVINVSTAPPNNASLQDIAEGYRSLVKTPAVQNTPVLLLLHQTNDAILFSQEEVEDACLSQDPDVNKNVTVVWVSLSNNSAITSAKSALHDFAFKCLSESAQQGGSTN